MDGPVDLKIPFNAEVPQSPSPTEAQGYPVTFHKPKHQVPPTFQDLGTGRAIPNPNPPGPADITQCQDWPRLEETTHPTQCHNRGPSFLPRPNRSLFPLKDPRSSPPSTQPTQTEGDAQVHLYLVVLHWRGSSCRRRHGQDPHHAPRFPESRLLGPGTARPGMPGGHGGGRLPQERGAGPRGPSRTRRRPPARIGRGGWAQLSRVERGKRR